MSISRRAEQARAHQPWRVILVGRTGLDQILRRDERIELIRARDTIDAIGELADPIDQESPPQAIVLVAAQAEPVGEEIDDFISALRLIEPSVRVLRVGSDHESYDGCVEPGASLDAIADAITRAQHPTQAVSLKFVTPTSTPPSTPTPKSPCGQGKVEAIGTPSGQEEDRHAGTDQPEAGEREGDQPSTHTDTHKAEATASPADDEPQIASVALGATKSGAQGQTQAGPGPEAAPGPSAPQSPPEVRVVVKGDRFEHRAQGVFEEESALHRMVVMGGDRGDQPIAGAGQGRALSFAGPHDDQPLVSAMLAGRTIIDAAIERINLRLKRDDIVFDADTHTRGVPVLVGDQIVGSLVCADQAWASGAGLSTLAHQSRWLAGWIRLEKQQAELRRCAFTDSLTGAWNRRYFSRFLGAAIEQARLARQALTVMLFDIDGFKHYNDAYGHAAGDEILVETVRLLKSVIRPSDRVCRVGGDEFVVIFYEPSGPRDADSKPPESVYQIATRFQQQICQHRFPKLGHEALGTLTISAGLASFPWDGHDAESLLAKADQLAMESKRQGKNAITLGPGAEAVCHTKR